ncbi:37S ribosomal protein S9, mitochondrial [Claviceps digitariae]|nr:37S ribosomal protein S9, mitochondrial [Claviceps digitariae]
MATLAKGLRQFRCPRQLPSPQWHQKIWRQSSPLCIRTLNTTTTTTAGTTTDITTGTTTATTTTETTSTTDTDITTTGTTSGTTATTAAHDADPAELAAVLQAARIPYQGITHARAVPATPSYFSREPQFTDLYIRISKLFNRFHHLPIVASGEAPLVPWTKLEEMRAQMGEPIKASHYAKVLRVAKRLNRIEPTLCPPEVKIALKQFSRAIDPFQNRPSPLKVDHYGRAVGAGRRKASTARAFVVGGTGEVLVNGKPLNEAFGRVHDRESVVWPLTATERLDKYNVWALVQGGGKTGQAEAITLAVAKALLAHEPDLKPALRKAGCITRDARTVERKKHGHVKARKMPAWVKR